MSPKKTANLAAFVMSKLPEHFLRNLMLEDFREYRIRVFPWAVTIWLMLCQRFGRGESLAAAVDRLREGECDVILEETGARKLPGRGGGVSNATGGYSQARKRVPLSVIEKAADHLNRSIEALHREMTWHGRQVYLVDGSCFTLPHSKVLLKQYPSCENQYGASRWPVMRTCFVHNLVTGVAHRPVYGPMYGAQAVGELELFHRMQERLPRESVIVGDRLYGSFRVIYETIHSGRDVLVRLAKDRARPFLQLMKAPGEITVSDWQTGEKNRKKRLGDLGEEATISGRFIWHRLTRKGFRPMDLYLFTTLEEPQDEIAELYGMRWNIETDIRSLKTCLNLDEISSKTPDMVHKELIMGHTAYNLIRHIAAIAAERAGVDPRRVSFRRVLNFVTIAGPRMPDRSPDQQAATLDRFANGVRQLLNPKRERPPEPRKVVPKRKKFPPMRESRAEERKALMRKLKEIN